MKAMLGGNEYTLAPVRIDDWAQLAGNLKQDAIDTLLSATRSINPSVLARSLAQISQTIYDDAQLLNAVASPRYSRWLVARSINRAGKMIKESDLDEVPGAELYAAAVKVLVISGLATFGDGSSEGNPTEAATGGPS